MRAIDKKMENSSDIETYREVTCANCPGTLWGSKSICRVINKHISEIEFCNEWVQKKVSTGHKYCLDPALEILQRVEEDLKDFHWMVKEIDRIKSYLQQAGEGLTGQYGIESAMPKSKGTTSDPVNREVQRRIRQWNRMMKLEDKVKRIEQAAEKIQNEKERTVLECMLDGVKMGMIARHVGLSRQKVNDMKRELLKKMAWELYVDELREI